MKDRYALLVVFFCFTFTASNFFEAAQNNKSGIARKDPDKKEIVRVQSVVRPTKDFTRPEPFEIMQGGAGTSLKAVNHNSFSWPLASMRFEERMNFGLGDALFDKLWVMSPSSTQASDGLGPFFNARACETCHFRNGRGRVPESGQKPVSIFLRLSRPASSDQEKNVFDTHEKLVFPDPVYGYQLQNFAVSGLKAEGDMNISYKEKKVVLDDGNIVFLRQPTYGIASLAFGPLDRQTTLSPRITPPMIGLGLVEQIHEADILAHADPDDIDGDGISGKPQKILNEKTGKIVIGRFGWKAANATLRTQAASALAGDIGISSPDAPNHYGDCMPSQTTCLAYPNGIQEWLGDTEAPDPIIELITFYSQNLAVPGRRNVGDETVLKGKKLFYEAGCTSCHIPKFVTRRDAPQKAHAFQLIWPYSDFLLHDMGDGLADGQQVGEASGREWRTPPLWGIGLTKVVSGHTQFLHDGRARNLVEAILWHGGEARKARDAFAAMDEESRAALIDFLRSL